MCLHIIKCVCVLPSQSHRNLCTPQVCVWVYLFVYSVCVFVSMCVCVCVCVCLAFQQPSHLESVLQATVLVHVDGLKHL